jgi:alkanesulfonate monooxygenase SsuD/methylene tetrahydromethanopterin reductase-like flavin-dependent oxidoreductase (luciferase family)
VPDVTVGLRVPYDLFQQDTAALRRLVARAEAAGIDRLTVGDHVSFRGGQGFDGLLQTGALAALSSTMQVQTAVYLLALRHPVPAARQIATVANMAPGRLILGVGVGGEDPHEYELCGVDPRTRGRRLDECLDVVRALLTGDEIDHRGEFFQLERARILPRVEQTVPIVIGGRSDAAMRRTARRGDGWLGLFVSARRYAEAVAEVGRLAAEAGRGAVDWHHGMHFWCSFDGSPDRLAAAMEGLYQLPFSSFERYAPSGTPAEVAEVVRPYLAAGARHVNLAPVQATFAEAVDGAAEVAARLRAG